ncbi:unnamed protein product, partial [Urochloa humidicola]
MSAGKMSFLAGREVAVGAKTQAERAREALRVMNDDNRKGLAFRFADDARLHFLANTRVLVYNATGDTLRLAKDHDWHGMVSSYPDKIGNGQWGCCIHFNPKRHQLSTGAVVYRDKDDKDFLLAWSAPGAKAYCEIGGASFYDGQWDDIHARLEQSSEHHTASADGVQIEAQIESGLAPKFTAVIR